MSEVTPQSAQDMLTSPMKSQRLTEVMPVGGKSVVLEEIAGLKTRLDGLEAGIPKLGEQVEQILSQQIEAREGLKQLNESIKKLIIGKDTDRN